MLFIFTQISSSISVRPHCSAGQEVGQEVESAGGVKSGQCPHLPDRMWSDQTEGGWTDHRRRDGSSSRRLCSFMCHINKLSEDSAVRAALCLLWPDYKYLRSYWMDGHGILPKCELFPESEA